MQPSKPSLSADSATKEELESMTLAQLRHIARSRSLALSVNKSDLIKRLLTTAHQPYINIQGKKNKRSHKQMTITDFFNAGKNKESTDSMQSKKRKTIKKPKAKEISEEGEIKVESSSDSNIDITSDIIKICSYNINGIRAAARKGLEDYLRKENADIVCLSELRCTELQNPCPFPGYCVIWNECTEKAGYSGSAILYKSANIGKPVSVTKGIGCNDKQGRAITVEFESFIIINTYVPNSGQNLKFKERRLQWDKAMYEWIQDLQKLKKNIIWTGDLNVAIRDFDVYDGETNKQRHKTPGFTKYERESFGSLLSDLSLVDCYSRLYPDERKHHYTYYSMRSRMKDRNLGWRLDYFVVSEEIYECIDDIQVRKYVACSDHVPLVFTMHKQKE